MPDGTHRNDESGYSAASVVDCSLIRGDCVKYYQNNRGFESCFFHQGELVLALI